MKTILHVCILMVGTIMGAYSSLDAQTISVFNNPTATGLFAWTGSGSLSGYAGTPILFKNKLVLEYNASASSDPASGILQLAVSDGAGGTTLIPNPDGGLGVYFQSVQTIFHDSLFFIYLSPGQVQHLASFDGTAVTLYPNPDASTSGYIGSPRIFNDKLYLAYQNIAGVTQFGRFNGSGITLIPNPDASSAGFFNNYSVVFNNKICSRYVSASGPKVLATFDGNSWTILPNPDNVATRGFQPDFPVEYKSKLYWHYYGAANQFQYAVYDGISNPGLIPNPEDESSVGGGVTGFPIVLGDTLFFQYYDLSNSYHLAKFDGTSIKVVPNPDASPYGFYYTPVNYNNSLYIFYVTPDGKRHLAQYQDNGLKVFANPDAGVGYWDKPIVYGNELYFMYSNIAGLFQLGHFNGTSIQLIANPAGVYNGESGNNGYTGYPIIWNNILYMQFGSVPYGNAGNLAKYTSGVLPVTLLSFTAQKKGTLALLQWQTTNEINADQFIIERSIDSRNFTVAGTVYAATKNSGENNYSFNDDMSLAAANNSIFYYRLKMMDKDGKFTYSKIVSINIKNMAAIVKIFPNPAQSVLNIQRQSNAISNANIKIVDANGRTVLQKILIGNVATTSLNIEKLSAGIYYVTIEQDGQIQNISFVKQ